MRQLQALSGVIIEKIGDIIDKQAIVENKVIDNSVATFCRTIMFLLSSILLGLFLGDKIQLFFSWQIRLLASLRICSSLFYTHILKKIEISGTAVVDYLNPLVFLIIDALIIKSHFSGWQILGIMIIVIGGGLFFIDFKKWRFHKQFSKEILGIFAFNLILFGVEYYTFSYLSKTYHVNEISYITSIRIIMSICFFLYLIYKRKLKQLYTKKILQVYIPKVFASKFVDMIGTYLLLRAVIMSSVSQVSAIQGLSPIVIISMAWITQNVFHYQLEENIEKKHFVRKIISIILLIVGGFLIK